MSREGLSTQVQETEVPGSQPRSPSGQGESGSFSADLAWIIQTDRDLAKLHEVAGLILKKATKVDDTTDRAEAVNKCLEEFGAAQNPEAQAGKSGKVTAAQEMWEAAVAKQFHFDARGGPNNPLAGRFQRALGSDPKTKAEYGQAQGNKEKQAFRAKWAEKKYDDYKASKTFEESYAKEARSSGTYFAFARIAHEEGDGESGTRAAVNYTLKCLVVGDPFVIWDEWTKQNKYLYIVQGFDEKFRTAWSLRKQFSKCNTPATESDATAKSTVTASDKSSPKAKGKATTPKGTRDAQADSRKRMSPVQAALANAKKSRASYNQAVSQSAHILRNIEADKDWAWATTLRGCLQTAVRTLEDKISASPFLKNALTVELADLKTQYSAAELETELLKMKTTFDGKVDDVARECRILLAQHKARMTAAQG